jgi:MraZ protein
VRPVASFRGSFTHQIDGKSRLALPKPFRRITGVKRDGEEPYLVLTKGFNGCVSVYTEAEWEKFELKLRDDPFTDQAARDFVLELADATADVPVDTVGRILIPAVHMELGGFETKSEVRIIGLYDHFEIWSPARLDRHQGDTEGTFEERAQGFFGRRL